MADALRQKASEAYLDDDFESAIAYFAEARSVTPFASLLTFVVWSPILEIHSYDGADHLGYCVYRLYC